MGPERVTGSGSTAGRKRQHVGVAATGAPKYTGLGLQRASTTRDAMKTRTTVATMLTVALALGAAAEAAVPSHLTTQGVVFDNAGQPTSGDFAMTFALYDAESAQVPVWTESWPAGGGSCDEAVGGCVAVTGGTFEVALGGSEPLTASVLADADELWLGVSVEGEPELQRRRLGSVAYALHSASAVWSTTAGGLDCSGCITADHLADGVLPEGLSELPDDGLDEVSGGSLSNEFTHQFPSPTAPIPVPDNNPFGATDEINVPDVGTVRALRVNVQVFATNLAHTRVTLFDPNLNTYLLWDGQAPGNDLDATYPDPDATLAGDLTAWIGANAAGLWRVQVIDQHDDAVPVDGTLLGWSIEVETLDHGKVAVAADLEATGTVTGAALRALPLAGELPNCDPSSAGTIVYGDGALRLCDGTEWLRLTACSEACLDPANVACGEAIVNGCGEVCAEGVGTGLDSAGCPLLAITTECGAEVSDSCGNDCGVVGTALASSQCDDADTVQCDVAILDDCGNPCGYTGTQECFDSDVNPPGTTLIPTSAFTDPSPPGGWTQCAGFINTSGNDVSAAFLDGCLPTDRLRVRAWNASGTLEEDVFVSSMNYTSSWPNWNYLGGNMTKLVATYWTGGTEFFTTTDGRDACGQQSAPSGLVLGTGNGDSAVIAGGNTNGHEWRVSCGGAALVDRKVAVYR